MPWAPACSSSYDLRACVADGNCALSSDRVRAVNGEADGFTGGNADSVRKQLQELTGLTGDAGAYSAFRGNGSGWVMASHGQVEDGDAEHCYMRVGGSVEALDNYWMHGSYDWSRDPNLNWLTGITLP